MKKVLAIVGSPRKGHTDYAVRRFTDSLAAPGGVECEIVRLGGLRLETCRGCKVCFLKGEELCPLKDDRDVILAKMAAADGVVFASPNYSFQVAGIMKVFLDRLGYVFHRPRYFGKTFTSIVPQGIYGGRKIVRYLDFLGRGLGFNVVRGSCFTAFEPMTEVERAKADRVLDAHAARFRRGLERDQYPVPSLMWLMAFRNARTQIRLLQDETWLDYRYFRDRGWFASDYFYPVRLNAFRKAAGGLFDFIGAMSARKH